MDLITPQFVGSTETVDEPGYGFFGDGVAFIMGELVVLDDAAVLVGGRRYRLSQHVGREQGDQENRDYSMSHCCSPLW